MTELPLVLIPTYGRAGTLTTAALFRELGHEVRIACHTHDECYAYCREQPELKNDIYCSEQPTGPHGANAQRAWLITSFVKAGSWCLFADDNIRTLQMVDPRWYPGWRLPVDDPALSREFGGATWHHVYKHPVSREWWHRIVDDMLRRMTVSDFWCGGFATNTSPLFRPEHWRTVGYVSSKLMLWKHDDTFPWSDIVPMDDFNYSAEQHLRHGGVLINHWCYPVAAHYAAGGIGSYISRIPARQMSVALLLERYPGLLRVKSRPGFAPNTELTFALKQPEAIARWRQNLR